MLKENQFIISIPEIVPNNDLGKIKAGANSDKNYFTEGAQRSTKCCDCDSSGINIQ